VAREAEYYLEFVKNQHGYYSKYPVFAPVIDAGSQVYNVKVSGATGNGTTDDTAAINTALSFIGSTEGGGIVYVPPGTYLISAPLVMYSDTTLLVNPAATIILATGSNCNMVRNVGVTANRTTADGAATATTTVVTSATANFTSADIGSSLTLANAGGGGQIFVTTIVSLNSATSVNVATTVGSTVSGKALNIYRRDSHIEVAGGIWNRQNNGSIGSLNGNNFHFRHLDHLKIHDLYYTASDGKNSVAVGDITQYSIYNIELQFVGTVNGGSMDGIHNVGPASYGYISNIKGTTNDDFIAFTPADLSGFNDVAGDIQHVDVENIHCVNAWHAFKLIGGTGCVSRDISVRGLHGSTVAPSINIHDDGTGPADIDGFTMTDVDVTPNTFNEVFILGPSAARTMTFRNISYSNPTGGVAIMHMKTMNGGAPSIVSLVVDGFSIQAGVGNVAYKQDSGTVNSLEISRLILQNTAATLAPGIRILTGAQVDNLLVSNSSLVQSSNQNNLIQSEGTVSYVGVSNLYMNGGMRVLKTTSTAAAMIAEFSNLRLVSNFDVISITSQVDLTFSNIYVTVTQTHLFSLISAAAVFSVRGWGLINPGAVNGILRDGTQTPQLIAPELPVDVAIIAANAGDMAFNTNAGSGPAGRVIYRSGAWALL
jgi:Pectate lyase superfamily protein